MHPMKRLVLRRLVSPLFRGRHSPEYTARGTAIGLFAAFTPTVGIQMPVVLAAWAVVRWLRPSWDFNLLVALAWTWVTNALTMAPVYYVFLVTGRVLLGRWDRLRGFGVFQDKLTASIAVDAGPLETLWVYMVNLFEQFGLPMWVGSLPWAFAAAWLGYRWSLRLVISVRARRDLRRAARVSPSAET